MYCTIENIKDLIPENLAESLISGDDSVIEKAISAASAMIDAYLGGSYEPQETANSPFLQAVAEKIVVYNLFASSAYDDTPQIVTASYIEAITALEKLQKGLLCANNSNGTPKERQSEVFTNKTASDKTFSQEGFKGF